MNKRTLITYQISLFVMLFLLTYLFNKLLIVKLIISILFVTLLTSVVIRYLETNTGRLKSFMINYFSLLIIFEFCKKIESFLGLTPKYNEIAIISLIGSSIIILIYLCVVFLIAIVNNRILKAIYSFLNHIYFIIFKSFK